MPVQSVGAGGQIDYFTLRTELITDPLNLGYSGYLATNDAIALAGILDAPGSGAGFTLFKNNVQPADVVNAIQPTDFTNMTQTQIGKLQLLFVSSPIDVTQSGTRGNFQNVFSGTATLKSGFLNTIATYQGSRSEVLFGNGVFVQDPDIRRALSMQSGISG